MTRLVWTLPDGQQTARWTVDEGGNGSSTAHVLGPFPFAFDDPGLNDGIAFYTPTVGDVLFDAWIEITTRFDGTTPSADIGPFVVGGYGAVTGVFSNCGAPVDLSVSPTDFDGLHTQTGDGRTLYQLSADSAAGGYRQVPNRFSHAFPWKIVVSQDGQQGGAAVGGTAGEGAVYLVIATPGLT